MTPSPERDGTSSSPAERQRGAAAETLGTPDGRLRLEFHWIHDRFAHRFLRLDPTGGDIDVVGQSLEGDSGHDWPPSPPIQQLSAEPMHGQTVLLGVGAAGQSHWSISVEVVKRGGADGFKFDLACRCKSTPEQIGSRYRTTPGFRVEPVDASLVYPRPNEVSIRPNDPATTQRWSYLVFVEE